MGAPSSAIVCAHVMICRTPARQTGDCSTSGHPIGAHPLNECSDYESGRLGLASVPPLSIPATQNQPPGSDEDYLGHPHTGSMISARSNLPEICTLPCRADGQTGLSGWASRDVFDVIVTQVVQYTEDFGEKRERSTGLQQTHFFIKSGVAKWQTWLRSMQIHSS
jgi:hypothetical protein